MAPSTPFTGCFGELIPTPFALVAAGLESARAIADLPGLELREEVRAENYLRPRIISQHASLDELQRPVLFSWRRTLFAGLEDEYDVAG